MINDGVSVRDTYWFKLKLNLLNLLEQQIINNNNHNNNNTAFI